MARILIVDDALFIRHSMKAALTAVGHDVVGEAENGMDGLRKIAKLAPDLVILDVNMPEMDGVQMLEILRQHHAGTRVMICSAMTSGPQAERAQELGVQGFLRKPYQPEDLIAAVIMALSAPLQPSAA